MFGHLDLDLADDRWFRTCRCGLCHALAIDYGIKARLLTNDDLSLCLWLVLSLKPSRQPTRKALCPLLARRNALAPESSITRFAAAAAILLSGEKLLDDELDEGRKFSGKTKKWFGRMTVKAQNVLQELGYDPSYIPNAFSHQRDIEQMEDGGDLASYAAPTGKVLGTLYRHAAILADLAHHAEGIGEIGQALGKIIYLLDSVVDYRRDLLCNAFNPLIYADSFAVGHLPPIPSEQTIHSIITLLAGIRADVDSALQTLPENVDVRKAFGDSLDKCINKSIASAVESQSKGAVERPWSWRSWFNWQAGLAFLSNPRVVMAAEGKSPIDQCAGNTVVLILMFFIYCAVCRGCRNSCACGHYCQSGERITVDEGCGGNRTYRRDSCTSRYRRDDNGCC